MSGASVSGQGPVGRLNAVRLASSADRSESSPPASVLYWVVFLLVLTVLCLPVIAVTYHPLVDYPNHLARAYILHHYHDNAVYQDNYVLSREVLPNLAVDLIVPTLLHFTDWITASQLFLCSAVILFSTGCHRLGTAIRGHQNWLVIPSMFFVYNSALLYGYVNYIFGLGCFAWAFGYWLPRRHHWTIPRVAIATMLTCAAYVSHLSAYSFLAAAFVTVGAWDLCGRRSSLYSVAVSLLPLAPPAALYCMQMVERGEPGTVQWNSLLGKFIALLPLFLTYSYRFDLVFLIALGILCVTAISASRESTIEWPSFLAGLVLLALLLASPKGMLTGSGADARFLVPAALLLVLSVKLTIRRPLSTALFLACLILFSLRVGLIWNSWREMDHQIAEQISLFSVLPEGARVYPAFPSPDLVQLSKEERSLEHVISLATITRHAYVLSQFAIPGQQPVLFRIQPSVVLLHDVSNDWTASLRDAEYVWSYGIPDFVQQELASRCVPVAAQSGFTVWKVNR